jgi:RHS repeat-associated protein
MTINLLPGEQSQIPTLQGMTNPITLEEPNVSWDWEDGSFSAWTNAGNIANIGVTTFVVGSETHHALAFDTTATNPYIYCPPMTSFPGSEGSILEVRMKVNLGEYARITFRTDATNTWGLLQSAHFMTIPDGQWHTYYVDLSRHPEWNGNVINRFRIDLSNKAGDHVEVDWIRQVGDNPEPAPTQNFTFDHGTSQGWFVGGNIANFAVADGSMQGTATHGDPYLYGPPTYAQFSGDGEPIITIRMKVSAGTVSQLYFINDSGAWQEDHKVDFTPLADNQWHTDELDMSANANWAGHRIQRFRLDPTHAPGASFAIDWIRSSQPLSSYRAVAVGINPDLFQLFASDVDAYGMQRRELYKAASETEPHGYTGQEEESDLGLYHYGARLYLPELGRFLQVDPMREFVNSFSYVRNSPIMLSDPTGKDSAVEVARDYSDYYFRQGKDGWGYFWSGASGFLSMTDSLSKVFDHHFINERDDVTGWTYFGAVLNLADVIPVAKLAQLRNVWKLGPSLRGFRIEKILYGSKLLPQGFKTIDVFQDGVAISVKSIDTASGYKSLSSFKSAIKGYITKLSSFKGASRGGVEVAEEAIKGRQLDLVLPSGSLNNAEKAVLNDLIEHANNLTNPVKVVVKEF